MNRTIEKPSFTFGPDDVETEQGNTWLFSEDSSKHIIWIEGEERGDKKTYLEISIVMDNDPGLHVGVIESTEAALRNHIHKKCDGWYVRRCNIDGVNVTEDNMVANPSPDDEDAEGEEGVGL